jgi:flagellar biosynthesis protein FlhA
VAAEADFYGAMDGASKFVRGDAVAGILILLINMVGGVAIGALMHGLSLGDAFRLYALLTIGDGLVAQIPSLLLSASAAIIVTRVNSEAKDFEQQISSQLLASPSVLYGAAGLMLGLGIIPGMPWLTFLSFAAVLASVAWKMSHQKSPAAVPDTEAIQASLLNEAVPELDWQAIPFVEPLCVVVGYRLVSLIDQANGAPLRKRIRGVRQGLSESLGFLLPQIGVRDDLSLKPSQYAIAFDGVRIVQADIYADHLMAIPSPQTYGELDGIPGVEPAFGMPVIWIAPENKAHALGLGYQVVDIPSVITTHVSKVIREHLPELIHHEDVPALLERLAAIAPKLSAALEKALTHSQMLKVFRVLLAEQVSIKDIVPIATTLLENAEVTKDPILLAAEVRCTLRRQIAAAIAKATGEIQAFNLSNDLENMLLGSLNQARQGGKPALDSFPVDPNLLSQLQARMPIARDQMKQSGNAPLLLVMPQIRPLLARYARLFAPGLAVLSYNEIPEQREVSIIGSLG